MEGWMLFGRERELEEELCHLLFQSPTTPSSSGTMTSTVSGGGGRRRGRKRVRDNAAKLLQEADNHDAAANAKPLRCTKTRKKQQTTSTLVTTVPDFDGYQWRKYGQKQIEGAKYPRSYYRCINSTDQGCRAKRTVQRNDDDDIKGGGGAASYTVTYILEHTCKSIESAAALVILETTGVRANQQPAAPEHIDEAGSCPTTSSPATSSSTSDIMITTTWSSTNTGGTSYWSDQHGDLLAGDDDCWDTTAPAAISAGGLLEEMDFAGPIRSPVHITADGWMDDLLLNAWAY